MPRRYLQSSFNIHIVLDHSALIPYGDKPEHEKEAIMELGDILPEIDAVIYATRTYLKTLCIVLARSFRGQAKRPKLQARLKMMCLKLVEYANVKKFWCRTRVIASDKRGLKIHILGRSALERVDDMTRKALEAFTLTTEDIEVIAIAILAQRYSDNIFLVSTDRHLLEAVHTLKLTMKSHSSIDSVKAVTPAKLLEFIQSKFSR